MTNSATERFLFFCSYRFRKLFSKPTADDHFRKRFYRATKNNPVSILSDNENEIVFSLKNERSAELQLAVRKKNSSDIQVFSQVFVKKEYESLVNAILDKVKADDIKFVIDAGANVGYTSLYLQQFFPKAFFVVIEPDEKNLEQLKKNFSLNKLDNNEKHLSGVWSSDGWLKINKDADEGKEWAYYVTESATPTGLKGISLQTLFAKSGFPLIDILKIDIEGGEKELFSKAEIISPILQKTRFAALEIHDHLADRQHILSILKKNNFTWFDHEELTIATNQSLISS